MGQDARDSLTLPRQTGEQAAAKFMLELLYAVVWRVHTLDGREAKKQSLFGMLEIRLLKTVLLGVVLCNQYEQSVLVIRVAVGLCF